jgi:hypothetical protein
MIYCDYHRAWIYVEVFLTEVIVLSLGSVWLFYLARENAWEWKYKMPVEKASYSTF